MTDAIQKRTPVEDMFAQITLHRPKIEKVLPKHITVDRFVTQVSFALSRNPKLADCAPKTVISSVMQLAELGLDPSGNLGSAWLAPFQNHGTLECVAIPGYRGLIDLAVRSAEVKGIYAEVVFWGDEFDVELGDRARIHHKPQIPTSKEEQALQAQSRTWDNVRAAYAVATLRGGTKQFRMLTFQELERVRLKAPGGRSMNTPWAPETEKVGARIQMYQKSPIRALCKQLPLSPSKALAQALAMEDELEARQRDEEKQDEKEVQQASRSGAEAIKDALKKGAQDPEDAEWQSTDNYTGPQPPDDLPLPTLDKK